VSVNQAKEIAERLRRTITEQNISTNNGKRIKITVSIGVACFSKHAQSLQSIIHNADIAMYSAKKNGRNRVRTA
jgi:diguanylate cyclase (GGDEF)-like protein